LRLKLYYFRGVTKLKLVIIPRQTNAKNVNIGYGGANSLIIGANTVINLDMKLHIPIACYLF
jgi:hypothetical protein